MTESEREILIEAATTAYRERDRDGRILPSPAWADLLPDDRERVYDVQASSRLLEAGWDESGLSAAGRAVVRRAARLAQLG